MSDSVQPHGWHPTRLHPPHTPLPWDSPGKNTGVGCHFLLQCIKVKSESEVAQSCLTLETPWTAAYQAPPSMGFSRQEYWSGVPSPSLIKCFRILIFMDTHFHGQLSSVFLFQVTYYNFLIFIMHSFLKLQLSSYHLHYIIFPYIICP